VKCPTTASHLDVVLKGAAPERHVTQMQWQMACAGRRWCDYVSYDPRLPEPTRVVILRIDRDDARIAALEDEVRAFLTELDARAADIRAATGAVAAAATREPPPAAAQPTSPAPEVPPADAAAPTGEAPAPSLAMTDAAAPASDTPERPAGEAQAASPAEEAPAPSSHATPAARMADPQEDRRWPPARAVVDLGSGRRQPLTPRQRLALYEAHGGICCICGNRIIGGRWVDEHVRPLSLGGSNDVDNRAPAHERCAQEKTRDDLRRLAKAKAQKRAFLGIRAATRLIASRPFPASDKIRPDLSPLGPPRAARFSSDPPPAGDAPPPDEA
jgi:5-methylcytosine-specific restriction endonuclease McrA